MRSPKPGIAGLWLSLLAPSPAFLPRQERPAALAEELDALIARTNALKTLEVTYRGDSIELVVSYQAPDRARLSLSSERGIVEWWFVAGTSVFHADYPEDRWARFESPRPGPSFELMEALFPPVEKRIEPGVILELRTRECAPQAGPNLMLDHRSEGRSYLFGWLHFLREHHLDQVERGVDSLIWSDADQRWSISRASGLVEHVELGGQTPVVLSLAHVELDQELDPGLFRWPAAGDSAAIDEVQHARVFDERYGPMAVRKIAFLRLEEALRSGRMVWDERTRLDWGELQRTLHRERMESLWGDWERKLREYVDEVESWSRGSSREDVSRLVGEERRDLVRKFEQYLDSYVAELPRIGSEKSLPRAVLFQVERDSVTELVDALVEQPILRYFDERLVSGR